VIVNDSWGRRSREGVLLVAGVALLCFEALQPVVFSQEPDKVIVGAALALLGIIPVIQKDGGDR
jgi:hypothetical protein